MKERIKDKKYKELSKNFTRETFLQTYCNTSQTHNVHGTPTHHYHICLYLLQAFRLYIHATLAARTKQEKLERIENQRAKEHDAAYLLPYPAFWQLPPSEPLMSYVLV